MGSILHILQKRKGRRCYFYVHLSLFLFSLAYIFLTNNNIDYGYAKNQQKAQYCKSITIKQIRHN